MLVAALQNGIELSKKAITTGYVKWRTVTLERAYQWNFSRINLEYLTYLIFKLMVLTQNVELEEWNLVVAKHCEVSLT